MGYIMVTRNLLKFPGHLRDSDKESLKAQQKPEQRKLTVKRWKHLDKTFYPQIFK